jgi:hypothetical protein
LQANRAPEAATEFPGGESRGVSFTRPRDRNEEMVAQGTFGGGLTGAALRRCGGTLQSSHGCGTPCRLHPGFG